MSETPWEPPLAGTETEHLIGMLERLRATFRWKADGLDAAGLNVSVGASSLTIGALLNHLAAVESLKFTVDLGQAPDSPWREADWSQGHQSVFTSAAEESPDTLYARWDEAVARSRTRLQSVLDADGWDAQTTLRDESGTHASLRRLVCDLIEEYGRHTGHADLLREAIDGRVGEDPPPGWRPVGAGTDRDPA